MSSLVKKNNVFTIDHTNYAKGIGIILLLIHHLFFNNPDNYDLFKSVFYHNSIPVECLVSTFGKVCVAIFVFLSGYGLFFSYSKYQSSTKQGKKFGGSIIGGFVFSVKKLLKLLSSYWIVFIIFVPMGLLFGRSFIDIYGSNPLHYLADFFGVSYLFYNYDYTMNLTWWFMSLIIVYYIVYPILHKLMEYSAELLLSLSIMLAFLPIGFRNLTVYLAAFVFGMYSCKNNIFRILSEKIDTKPKRFGVCIAMIITFAYARYTVFENSLKIDFAFAFSIILFSFFFVGNIPILRTILKELGEKSGLIFMFHTFIYYYYFKDFIYSFKYSPVILIVLLVLCYLMATIIDYLMRISGYKKLVEKISKA